MADAEVKYEAKTVRSIRGMEARTIAKWQKEGWELVSQSPGKVQAELTLRRAKPKMQRRMVAVLAAGAVVALIAVIAIIIGASQGGDAPESSAPPTEGLGITSEQPSEEVTETSSPSGTPDEEMLTAENNEDLAALLTGSADGPAVEEFAQNYGGSLIEFDGSICAMNAHGDYDTRYDILVAYGDYSETQSSGGPNFQFRDVNTTYDLHLVGQDIPDDIGVGDNLHIVARVGAFEPDTTLFLLEPVSTEFR
ncbi:DUF4839 domain-containing protein [Occultella kanbiaonis]|uniref:DUF4839 domain-containing protein n=1 Tax=Occultella kanbiaonis TaxID=2675754 RepID=UPI0012B95300|nr:DUF4839 domain-containing protein [Occultella kanbiaonis]